VANITARPLAAPEEIRDELVGQLTAPVRWTASIQWMIGQGVGRFVEIGPKEVLAGLVRRIDSSVETQSVCDVAAVEQLVGA
jgi:[acyl-carrier-protein] S-malonyltransferase